MDKLKPCPFCGCGAISYQPHMPYSKNYIVQCNRCGASTLSQPDEQTAIEEWNKRTGGKQ